MSARHIRGSNSIEGYNVSAAVAGAKPIEAQSESWLALKGYRDAMTYVLPLATDPHFRYHNGFLRGPHFMMIGYHLARNPGRWRPDPSMSDLNLVMIHPFSDCNGRIARCLQTLVLGREGILEPQFCSIEEYLGGNTRTYYDVLASVGKGKWSPRNDAGPGLDFNLTAHPTQASTLLQ